MEEEKDNSKDKKFIDYFRNTFFVDRRELIKEFDEDDVDKTYNFKTEEENAPKNVFEKIRDAFTEEKYREIGAFFSKIDIMEENLKNDSKRNLNILEGNFKEIQSNEAGIEIDFKDTIDIINNINPYELYSMLNENTDMFNKIVLPKISKYKEFTDEYDKIQLEMKGEEIMGIQRSFETASSMFNKSLFEEFITDIMESWGKNTLKSYMKPLVNLPRKILFGNSSIEDTADVINKIKENDRLHNMVKDKKDFISEHDNIKQILKKEFYYTNFDKIDEIGKVKDNFKINTLDSYVEVLDFNRNDYLKEYRRIKPFLNKYNIKKMNIKNIKRLYEDRERLIIDIENESGIGIQNITRSLILNKVILNKYMDKKLKEKSFIVIDNMNSSFFGLKVPVINGKIDTKFINTEFDILSQSDKNKMIKEAKNIANSKTRFVNQLIMTDKRMFNLNDVKDEIRNIIFNKIGIDYKEEIDELIKDTKKIEDELNESSGVYKFNNGNYEFKSRLDNALIRLISPIIEYDYVSKQRLTSYMNANSTIMGDNDIYNSTFEEFYKYISENPSFKIEKSDLYKLKYNKSYINKMLREGMSISYIVDKYKFKNRDRVIFVLEVFKENLNNNMENIEIDFNPVFKDSFFEKKHKLGILREKSNSVQKKASEFSEILRENQEKIDAFNIRNREILDENFENVMKNQSRINLINEIEKTNYDIEDLKFWGQNSENIKKRNHTKKKIYYMQNKLTSTMAIDMMLRNKSLENKYREVFNLTDRFYIEIMKDILRDKWQIILKDYYTDRELLKNDITINPNLNVKLRREIEYNLEFYNVAGVKEKVKILNNIISNLDTKRLNRDFFREELKKTARIAKRLINGNKIELTYNNKKMHELLNKDMEKLKKMDEETKKTVNKFADRFMNRLEKECEDKEFSERFGMNIFFDREFIDYITKYENVDNSYVRELLAIDNEGTVSETSYQNNNFQEISVNDRLARYREQMKINTLRKTSITGKKVFENPEIKRFKNTRKKLDEEIEEVKSKMKEILKETEREYEEDMQKIIYDRKKTFENQDKTRKKIRESDKLTIIKAVEEKKEEERDEAVREYEEDMRRVREDKEKEVEYVRELM